MSLRRGFPVLLDLALIQVGILLSYLARFGNELFLYRNAWEPYFDIWVIFNFSPWSKFRYAYSMGRVQLFLLCFYSPYPRLEYRLPSPIEKLAPPDH